jgi:ribosomal protein L37AE/L43A
MAAKKGSKCPSCGQYKMHLRRGVWRCAGCKALCWTLFDRPYAGKPRKGYKCYNCERQTVHPLGRVKGADVWRCSTCGTTLVDAVAGAKVTFSP